MRVNCRLCLAPQASHLEACLSDPVTTAVAKLWVPGGSGGAGASSCTSAGRRPIGGPREPAVPARGWRTGLPLWGLALLLQLLPTAPAPKERGGGGREGAGNKLSFCSAFGQLSCTVGTDSHAGETLEFKAARGVSTEGFWVCGKSREVGIFVVGRALCYIVSESCRESLRLG